MKNSVFKLTKFHLFLIIIGVLILSTLGFNVKEYFENNVDTREKDYKGDRSPTALNLGSRTDPFENRNFNATIAELENIIIPGRDKNRHHHDKKGNHWDNKNGNNWNQKNKHLEKNSIDKDKYILKSEVVPPVCPKCPDSRSCPRPKPCQPCPPCARCPEPAFECKKVPNYNAINASNINSVLPIPRLNSFAQFN